MVIPKSPWKVGGEQLGAWFLGCQENKLFMLTSVLFVGIPVTPEKQALGLLKKEKLNILKTIPLCNSTSVETLKGQIVLKKKKYLR